MKPIVTEWKGSPQMDTGAPMPHIRLTTNGDLMCAYIVSEGTLESPRKEEYAVVVFRRISQSTFGYPNDEALGAHPLFPLGIAFYTFNVIENSPYSRELGQRNASVFPGTEDHFNSMKHYLVSFHDETPEVVCQAVEFPGRTEAWDGDEAIFRIGAEPAA